MKHLRTALLLAALALAATGASAADAPAKPKKESGFVFSLLPKSLQRNPKLDFNILTEMTAVGKRWPTPTKENPIYYVSVAGGIYNGGVGADFNTKAPPVEKLEAMMRKALAETGYVASDEKTHPPTIAVIYHWGSHSFQPDADVADADGNTTSTNSEAEMRRTLLDRAKLLGGEKFVKEVIDVMEQLDHKAMMDRTSTAAASAAGGDFMGSVGDAIRDPWDLLRSKSPEMDRLVDELFSSSFFVVASAYDYAALAKKQRVLLWRTKMTVNSIGVNMLESVPPLIASAGPYFGRETADPVLITKKVSRDGKVEMGTPVVVPDAPAPAKPATPAK